MLQHFLNLFGEKLQAYSILIETGNSTNVNELTINVC